MIQSLTPLQAAVLRVVAARGAQYAPFEAATIAAYQTVLDTTDRSTIQADATNVQQALVALQDKALIWKEKRGVYALEDSHTAETMEAEGLLAAVPPAPAARSPRRRQP